jgi:hypothetical protein
MPNQVGCDIVYIIAEAVIYWSSSLASHDGKLLLVLSSLTAPSPLKLKSAPLHVYSMIKAHIKLHSKASAEFAL